MRLRVIAGLGLALVLCACGGGGGGGGNAGKPATQTESAVLSPQGSAISTNAGVKLAVPAGAVTQSTPISVTPVAEAVVPALPTGTSKAGSIFSIEPHGSTFAAPITVRVPFDPTTVPPGATPTLFKAQPGGTFVEITPVTIEGNELVAQISSFSFFTVMAKAAVNLPPVAVLTAPSGALQKNQALQFSSTDSTDPENSLRSLRWNFGDGSDVETQTTPGPISHTYSADGQYTVTLTAEDALGLTESSTTQITVSTSTNAPPVVKLFTSKTSTIVGTAVNFSPVGSKDADGTIVKFAWDFGDGTQLSRTDTSAVSHTFSSAGSKTVTLTAIDNLGATASATREVQVRVNAPPLASLAVTGVLQANADLSFLPTGSSDSDGSITLYSWDFGDGATAQQSGTPSALLHRYAAAGSYNVKLTVTDNDGAQQSAQRTLVVSTQPPANRAPVAQIAANLTGPVTGQEVALNPAGSSDVDGQIVAYKWEFGDGATMTTTTSEIQRHGYVTPGDKTVRLTVTDNQGGTGVYQIGLSVQSFAATGLLNDTGISWCSNLTGTTWVNNAVCSITSWIGKLWGTVQDAWFGRDALALANTLNKSGRGVAGFDFTRLGTDGQPLAIQTGVWLDTGSPAAGTRWDCIRDNNTGLIWEVKRNDTTHLRHYLHQYTWYNSDQQRNGGWAGQATGGSCTGLGTGVSCNSQAYTDAVNQLPSGQALCGFRDWRLPTREELRNVAHTGATAAPAIDTTHFPNTFSGYYWSGSPDASGTGHAWGVSFTLGDDFYDLKTAAYAIRLVRSGL